VISLEIFLALGIAGLGVLQTSRLESLAREGIVVPATVVDRSVTKGKNPKYRIRYTYTTPSGLVGGGRETVDVDEYVRTREGGSISVTAHPTTPNLSQLGSVSANDLSSGRQKWALIALLVLGAGAASVILVEVIAAAQRRRLANGLAVPVRIDGVTMSNAKGQGGYVEFRYRMPDGSVQTGKSMASSTSAFKPGQFTFAFLDERDQRPWLMESFGLAELAPGAADVRQRLRATAETTDEGRPRVFAGLLGRPSGDDN